MHQSIQCQTTIQSLRNSISRSLPPITYHYSLLTVLLLVLAGFTLWPAPTAFGVTPAPGGGYAGANTALGQNALQSLSSGVYNTALGYQTLFNDTTGAFNTAAGSVALYNNTTGINNTATGFAALYVNTTGYNNTANGYAALFSNTTGFNNTANGYAALDTNTTGYQNTANGSQALFSNTTGILNTATGYQALYSNTTGTQNTANGFQALYSNTTGVSNTANGSAALYSNTTGSDNTATGLNALISNTTGGLNTANGYLALSNNTTGSDNTADGYETLLSNTIGGSNTANGIGALYGNTTGNTNTATGVQALFSNTIGSSNTADGFNALIYNTGSNNTALGVSAGLNLTTGSYNIDIGNGGVAAESNTIRIGDSVNQTATFIAGINGTAVIGTPVVVNSAGQLGTLLSSARFKQNIQGMGESSDVLLSFRPVTFRYKQEIDPKGLPQFGLVAEEVAKVDPDLVTRDGRGEPYTVRYEAVNAMLLNEFLKEHRKVQEQEAAITQLKSTVVQQKDFQAIIARQQEEIRALSASLKEQASQIQKVSAQLDLSSPRRAAQLAGND